MMMMMVVVELAAVCGPAAVARGLLDRQPIAAKAAARRRDRPRVTWWSQSGSDARLSSSTRCPGPECKSPVKYSAIFSRRSRTLFELYFRSFQNGKSAAVQALNWLRLQDAFATLCRPEPSQIAVNGAADGESRAFHRNSASMAS
jgi:hypothetical protein